MTELLQSQTFGMLVIQVGYLMAYGWLRAFIMPDKIAGLMRTTAILGSIQHIMEYLARYWFDMLFMLIFIKLQTSRTTIN